MINKPISKFYQEQNNRGIGPRGPDGRFIRSPSKPKRTTVIESESESETPLMDTESPKTPDPPTTTTTSGSFGRGRPKLVRDRSSPQTTAQHTPGVLTIVATNMTDTEVDRAIEDAKQADQELLIRDENGKVFTDNKTNSYTQKESFENSDLELASNLSSSTEIDTEEKEPVRRSKRLTKTNPIIRYNNPICHDYRKHRKKTEFGNNTESTTCTTGGERRRSLDRSEQKIQTLRPITNRNKQTCQERSTVHHTLDQWRNNRHNRKDHIPIGQTSTNCIGGMWRTDELN